MNKNILRTSLLIIGILVNTLSYGQYTVKPSEIRLTDLNGESLLVTDKEVSYEVIWEETFDGGLPADWQNVNLNDFCSFQHTYSGPQGPFSVDVPRINSTTAYNGFMILDSDYCNAQNIDNDNPFETVDAYIESPPVDLSDYPNVGLKFEHFFRYCCDPDMIELKVLVSNNGVDWVSFDVSEGLAPNNTSSNPEVKIINISGVAGEREEVWVRFHKKGATQYFWMIDDVSLISLNENDIEIVDVRHDGYTYIPDGLLSEMQFSAKVKNSGFKVQNDLQLTVNVNDYLFSGQSNIISSILPSSELLIDITEPYTFPAKGQYSISYEISQSQEDQVPENNFKESVVNVVDSVFARDRGIYNPGSLVWPAQLEISYTGNTFVPDNSGTATSISVALHENTIEGEEMAVVLFSYSEADGFVEISRSQMHEVTEDDINSEAGDALYISLSIDDVELDAGNIYLAAVEYSSNDLAVAADKSVWQPSEASFSKIGGVWEEEINTPMVRLNFGNNEGVCDIQAYFNINHDFCEMGNASIYAYPLTGSAPYSYEWETEPGLNEPYISGLSAGEYSVTITDSFECSKEFEVVIEVRDIEYELEVIESACGGANGVAIVTPVTGEPPFSYSWNTTPEQTDSIATGLEPGSYVVVISDANNCEIEVDVEIESIPSVTLSYETVKPVCLNDNGSILITPVTGTPPFNFEWSDDESLNEPFNENLAAGNYTIVVTDDNACAGIAEIELEAIEKELVVLGDIVHATCEMANGAIMLNVTDGEEPFEYLWSNNSTDKDLLNIDAGIYSVTVTDHWGCVGEAEFEIENSGEALIVDFTVSNTTSCGESDGYIEVIEPNINYTYSWYSDNEEYIDEGPVLADIPSGHYILRAIHNYFGCEEEFDIFVNDDDLPEMTIQKDHISCYGEEDGSIVINIPDDDFDFYWSTGSTDSYITNLSEGEYFVEIESEECFAVFYFTIIEPELLEIRDIEVADPNCHNYEDGSIEVEAEGGTPGYSFIWDNQMTGSHISGLPAGIYNLTVTDANNCQAESSYTLINPDEIEIYGQVVNPSQGEDNGSINVNVIGGVGELTFEWDSGHTGSYITGLGPGLYMVTVTDENGCTAEETFELFTTSIHDAEFAENISIYPNPAKDYINIEFIEVHGNQWNLKLYDTRGNLLRNIDLYDEGSINMIDLSGYSAGVYILKISSEIGALKELIIVK